MLNDHNSLMDRLHARAVGLGMRDDIKLDAGLCRELGAVTRRNREFTACVPDVALALSDEQIRKAVARLKV